MKTVAILLSGLFFLTLVSCDPEGELSYQVNNLSSKDVRVANVINDDTISTLIRANTKEFIFHHSDIGSDFSTDIEYQRPNSFNYVDTLYMAFPDSTVTCTKDIHNDANWYFNSGSEDNGDYTFSIQNKDLQ